MFQPTNVKDHFRVSNFVSGYRGGVRLACVVVSRHVFRSKQPALKYQLTFLVGDQMTMCSHLCVVLEWDEKITPLCYSRNL